ncbi:D930020B18Rik [Phodopus roborovskii]|uniref:D930020B18Rik protein n=1 Tax=Phodopus roborovskii TaxID=109678 RepID=A0AAU9YVA2_PHORO|nr:D930020B18Rik [Phodopus roborovskii]
MASPARSGFPARTNSRLDAFLRRHLAPEVYDAVRAYEPCIVVSDAEKHTFKYVVLSDRLIYLTENPPKSIRRVVALRDVLAIDLIDDYPEFLNSSDREINQHIRIVYSSTALKKECGKSKGVGKFLVSLHRSKANKKVKQDNNGPRFWRRKDSRSLDKSSLSMPFKDSLPCPSDLKHLSLPSPGASLPLPIPSRSCQSPEASGWAAGWMSFASNTEEPQEPPDHKDCSSEIPVRFDGNRNEVRLGNSLPASPKHSSSGLEKEESELHLYIISETSSIFLHLKSSWNNYIIRATLSQESLRSSEHGHTGNPKPYRSEEKIKHFSQLKSELFLQDNTLREILCVVTELRVAAQRNFILKRLFWKTSELFYFLVDKLHEYLPESRDKTALQNKSQRANELVACIEIIQTLGLMFRETEIESSRLTTLAAKKGTLLNLLVILISKPKVPKSCSMSNDGQPPSDSTSAEMSCDAQLQKLILEYTDKATALLYETLLVFQQGNLGLGSTKFAISWMMSTLQSCPPTMGFVGSIVRRVVDRLSASLQLLTPCQAVLLYQQLYILKSCLQYSKALAEYIRNHHSEEFRYFIHMPALERRLPVWYPITEPTTQLCHEVLQLIEQRQYAKC